MSNISPQKNARIPEQNISLRNLCKNFWLEETAILDMQMSKLPMISGYDVQPCLSKNPKYTFYTTKSSLTLAYYQCNVQQL
jgi:hypothetical protein